MKHFKTFGAATALLAVSAFALAAQGFTIKRVPKEGESLRFRVKADMDLLGQAANFTGITVEKTLKVDADGTYTMESTSLEGKAVFGGQEVDVPDQGATVSVYKPDGTLVEMRGASVDESAYRLATLNAFFEPTGEVKIGDTWTREVKATDKGARDATATYKLLAEEKVGDKDALKIETTVVEKAADGARNEGTIWLDKSDFSMLKATGKWTNMPLAGAPAPVNATYELTRVEG